MSRTCRVRDENLTQSLFVLSLFFRHAAKKLQQFSRFMTFVVVLREAVPAATRPWAHGATSLKNLRNPAVPSHVPQMNDAAISNVDFRTAVAQQLDLEAVPVH